ncbi:MAG TPA: KpsF/GutQ family sugar-phosphate isomerase [Thermodesulfobacteriota bacterium]|nr:KpsF/GutQ family sugar-phosphate isomerase [Thermodesulfobacteriota bacterium]
MKEILRHAREVIRIEAEAVQGLLERLDENFARAVESLLACEGRVVVTGIGKSGLVGRKIVATLTSTGTPAAFLHPVEGLHGDVGMVTARDILIVISNSGETAEIVNLLPSLKKIGARIIGLTGVLDSTLARASDMVIDVGVEREACPLGLAPTSSTTATLVIGDALAVVLMRQRKFEEKDFARFHPGGSLGERLNFRVGDLMRSPSDFPHFTAREKVADFLSRMNRCGGDFALILHPDGSLAGTLSDRDLRRGDIGSPDFPNRAIATLMEPDPLSIGENAPASEAMKAMVEKNLTALPVLDGEKRVKGVLTLRDCLSRRDGWAR